VFGAIALGLGLVALLLLRANFYLSIPAKNLGVVMSYFGKEKEDPFSLAKAGEKGLQEGLKMPGVYYTDLFWSYDVYTYDWPEVPAGKIGVRIKLYGRPLPDGKLVASSEDEAGVVRQVLPTGPHPINAIVIDGLTKEPIGKRDPAKKDYFEIIEVYPAVQIPPGYIGIHTILDGPEASEANGITVTAGNRGVQEKIFEEGKYFLNPYTDRVQIVSALAAQYSISDGDDLSVLSKDGFRISLSGMTECRLDKTTAARTYVLLNESKNDGHDGNSARLDDELLQKVILPNSTAFGRNIGVKNTATQMAGGATRAAMQKSYQEALKTACAMQGVVVEQAGITKVTLPPSMAATLKDRELAVLQRDMLLAQTKQQVEEAALATEQALAQRKASLVTQEKNNLEVIQTANEKIATALAAAEQKKEVAEQRVKAARDTAAATLATNQALAKIETANNLAASAKFRTGVKAFGGDGEAFAEAALVEKIAKAIDSLMANSEASSPLMRFFERGQSAPAQPSKN
jgi:hypothetical protein